MADENQVIEYSFVGNFKSLESAVKKSVKALSTLGNSFKKPTTDNKKLKDSLNKVGNTFIKVGNQANILSKKLFSLHSTANSLKKVFSLISGGALGSALVKAAKQSISYIENLNLFTVAMGDSVAIGREFIDAMSEIYGMDPSNLLRYAGYFYQLADAINMPSKASMNLSLSLTKAANDVASLFNMPIETVVEDLASGLQGMSRAVRKYGMDIRVTTLQQTALSLGITEQVQAMSEADRQGLRYITMMRQASNANGDFARTIEQPANQLRIFKEQMSQLGRAIGNILIGPLSAAMKYINGFVMALRIMINTIAALFGKAADVSASVDATPFEEMQGGIAGVGDAADSTAKKINKMLAPFDELNVLPDNTDTGGGTGGGVDVGGDMGAMNPAIMEEIESMNVKLESIRMKALDVRDAILAFFGFKPSGDSWVYAPDIFEQNLMAKFPNWKKTIEALFDFNYEGFISNFELMLNTLKQIATGVISNIVSDIANLFGIDLSDEGLAQAIGDINEKFFDLRKLLDENKERIILIVTRITELVLISKGLSTIMTILSTVFGPFATIIGIAGKAVTILSTPLGSVVGLFQKWAGIGVGKLLKVLENGGNYQVPAFSGALGKAAGGVGGLMGKLGALGQLLSGPLTTAFTGFLSVGALAFIGGFVQWMAKSDEFKEHLSNWKESLGVIFEGLRDIFKVVIDAIVGAIEFCATHFDWLYDNISGVIGGILDVLAGIVDFIAGVFTGDWERAWNGVVRIFKGIWDGIVNIVKIPINGMIALINGFLSGMTSAVNAAVGAINSISLDIPDWVPFVGGKHIGFSIGYVNAPSIPYLANGGVVTGPTMAMVGEGAYDEAVIPLGNSPQMAEFVDKIAQAVSGRANETPIQVKVYIGDEQVAEHMQRVNSRNRLQTNGGLA